MRWKPFILFLGLSLFFSSFLFAENKKNSEKIIQLSGQVKHSDYTTPIPGVSIVAKHKNRAAVSNFNGIYTIAIKESDTLVISYVGFKTKEIVLEKSDDFTNFRYQDIILEQDTIYLNPITVLPIPTGRAFDYAFVNVDFDNPIYTFRKNLNPQSIHEMARKADVTRAEAQFRTQKAMHDERGWDGLMKTGRGLKIQGLSDLYYKNKKRKEEEKIEGFRN